MKILALVYTALVLTDSLGIQQSGTISGLNKSLLEPVQQQQQQSPTSSEALSEADRLHVLVVKLYREDKYDEALPIAKKVLQIRETLLDPNDERIAAAAFNLAAIYEAQRKFEDAEHLLERALQLFEKKLGPENGRIAGVLDRLMVVYFNRAKFSESEKAAQRSLAISEKAFGADSVEMANSLHKLAEFYRFRSPKKAEPYYDRALMIMQKRLPLEKTTTEKLIQDYSCLYYQIGQREKIEGLANKYVAEHLKQKPWIPTDVVLNGKAIRLPKPDYSTEARAARAEGTVVIKVVIDETGKVIEARDMCRNNPILARASIASALKRNSPQPKSPDSQSR